MLHINSYASKHIENIYSDVYIPLKIRFGQPKSTNEHLIYWCCGDNRNVVEIGILKNSKELYSITLTNFCNVFMKDYEYSFKPILNENYIPVFSIDEFENDYINEEAFIKVYIGTNNVSVIFTQRDISRLVENEDIVFFIDENENWIGFNLKTTDEYRNNLIAQIKN